MAKTHVVINRTYTLTAANFSLVPDLRVNTHISDLFSEVDLKDH